jgi:hypothetical protein
MRGLTDSLSLNGKHVSQAVKDIDAAEQQFNALKVGG